MQPELQRPGGYSYGGVKITRGGCTERNADVPVDFFTRVFPRELSLDLFLFLDLLFELQWVKPRSNALRKTYRIAWRLKTDFVRA